MHAVLAKNQFFVKQLDGTLKAARSYDIFDPESNQKIIECREPNIGSFTKFFRFTGYKRMTPFHAELRTPEGSNILSVRRDFTLLQSSVRIYDEADKLVGTFKEKLISVGGKFDIVDKKSEVTYTLVGEWTSADFRFLKGGEELANVSKKWAGFTQEFFTSTDYYMLTINKNVRAADPARILIMAAAICIDMVMKE